MCAQAFENEQEQNRGKRDDEEEQVLGQIVPPPVIELGIQKDHEEGIRCIDYMLPMFAHAIPHE